MKAPVYTIYGNVTLTKQIPKLLTISLNTSKVIPTTLWPSSMLNMTLILLLGPVLIIFLNLIAALKIYSTHHSQGWSENYNWVSDYNSWM